MRKILFRLLIVVLLFLLTVLGVAYYKNMRPLSVIQGWFGMKQEIIVTQPSHESEKKVQVDAAEKINDMVESEMTGDTGMTGSTSSIMSGGSNTKATMTSSSSSKLSEQDKRDLRKIVDGLVIK